MNYGPFRWIDQVQAALFKKAAMPLPPIQPTLKHIKWFLVREMKTSSQESAQVTVSLPSVSHMTIHVPNSNPNDFGKKKNCSPESLQRKPTLRQSDQLWLVETVFDSG